MKVWISSLLINTISFCGGDRLISSLFEKNFPVWIALAGLLVIISSKNCVPWKNPVEFSLQVKQLQTPFSPAGHCTVECSWRASCGLLMALYRIWKRQVLQCCNLIKRIIFTAFKDSLEETGISVIPGVWQWRVTMTTGTIWCHHLLISHTSSFTHFGFCNINANVNTVGGKSKSYLSIIIKHCFGVVDPLKWSWGPSGIQKTTLGGPRT